MSDGMDFVFGEVPGRPEAPEFWHLSEILLGMDATTVESQDENDFLTMVKAIIPYEVLAYVSEQRGLRLYESQDAQNVSKETLANVMGMWIDGFIAGARYREKYPT